MKIQKIMELEQEATRLTGIKTIEDYEKCNGTGTLDTPETLLLDIRINAPTEHWGVSACDECKGYGNIKKC